MTHGLAERVCELLQIEAPPNTSWSSNGGAAPGGGAL